MNEEELLREVQHIYDKWDMVAKSTGRYFNIFEIAGISDDEVRICRVLHALLSPDGSHGQKATYLKLFVENVLKITMTSEELQSAKVGREYSIDNQRRIDLVIETNKRFIPIEVKIYASDQHRQVYDYYRKAREAKCYYLTLYGDKPNDDSLGDLKAGLPKDDDNQVALISFSDDILGWTERCVATNETASLAPIREILFQLAAIIRKLTSKTDKESEMETIELLTSSKKNILSAEALASAINPAKTEILKRFLHDYTANIEKLYAT